MARADVGKCAIRETAPVIKNRLTPQGWGKGNTQVNSHTKTPFLERSLQQQVAGAACCCRGSMKQQVLCDSDSVQMWNNDSRMTQQQYLLFRIKKTQSYETPHQITIIISLNQPQNASFFFLKAHLQVVQLSHFWSFQCYWPLMLVLPFPKSQRVLKNKASSYTSCSDSYTCCSDLLVSSLKETFVFGGFFCLYWIGRQETG